MSGEPVCLHGCQNHAREPHRRARGEPLVAPPAEQQGPGAQRLVELDLDPRLAVPVPDVAEPAAEPETLLTGRVLDNSVERDVLADDDLSHVAVLPLAGVISYH